MLIKLLLFFFHASFLSPIYSFKPVNNVKFNLKMNMLSDKAALISKIQQSIPKGSVIVVKYGGHAMEDFALAKFFCEDIAALSELGLRPVIVHGGGPQIAKTLKSLDITSTFVNGLRVTDPKTMEVAQMVLCGTINKNIVSMISSQPGVKGALGLSGLDSKLIVAKIKEPELGLVGEPVGVNTGLIKELLNIGLIPVIAPVGSNEIDGGSLNINADTAAGAVAEALKADRLLLLTDITGVLDKEKQLIESIPSNSLQKYISDGIISGGMIPKLETACQAVEAGVSIVSIMDGRVINSVLKALSGQVFGTKIIKG